MEQASFTGPVNVVLLLLFLASLGFSYGSTDSQDSAILRALMDQWQNTPPSWGTTDDPCGTPWEGVICTNNRVTTLKLPSMGIKGTLAGDIGLLTELQSLDLSYNKDLGGTLPLNIGNLKKLTILILVGCSFHGPIPDEIGHLQNLTFLALNSNQFSGSLPASLGALSNLYWLDVADNQLTGALPISSKNSPGLDQLLHTKHFHFNKNQFSGEIPEALFSSQMTLIHVLFDGNRFTGSIPGSLGLVQTLEVLRLDRNMLTGAVPANLNNLSKVIELNLANNQLTGALPDLTGMDALNYVDLSNNTFDSSESPGWFTKLQSLTALIIQSGSIHGQVPEGLFSMPQLQQVMLDDNAFNGTLDFGNSISSELSTVSFKNNDLSAFTVTASYNGTLSLTGNPVCDHLSNTLYCNGVAQRPTPPYSTSLAKCFAGSCPSDKSLSPQSCSCAYPYQGTMFFRAPFFRDVTNATVFQELERGLWTKLGLTPGSVFLQDPFFNSDSYLQLEVKLFPPDGGEYFNRSEIAAIGFDLSNQTYKPPHMFGPYYFIASPYPFREDGGGALKNSTGTIAGIAAGCGVLIILLIGAGIYALRQRRKAAEQQLGPFASWPRTSEDHSFGGAPQLKGARWFSLDEIRRCTGNFAEANEIGSGGYGKVYRGALAGGKPVAIKRAQQGSVQGGLEFKTEIELLSRVHHRNLVGLVGFCFDADAGEQMLVYEFVPNGSLKDALSGKSGVQLDWRRRLRVALGAARGLAYLHELADPPIIHRDVKSANILLDEALSGKVADFGLSKLVADAENGYVSTQVKGTLGYLDPEYYMSQKLTEKSDVYSFGVVLLELITARQPLEKGRYIVREVAAAFNPAEDADCCGLRSFVDPKILGAGAPLPAFRKVVQLAVRCTDDAAANRPTMSEVVKEIEAIMQSEGVNTASTSASSSATYGAAHPQHPYADSHSSFEYIVAKIEPK